MAEEKKKKTREEEYALKIFEWVKTERSGEICKFKEFSTEGGIEYVVFSDDSRINHALIGDVVLIHTHDSEVVGASPMIASSPVSPQVTSQQVITAPIIEKKAYSGSPVLALLEKSKKKNHKLLIPILVKIPSKELYDVVKENFEDVDQIILDTVYDQIKDSLMKNALKKELQTLYKKKKEE